MNYRRFNKSNPAPWSRNYRRMKAPDGDHGGVTGGDSSQMANNQGGNTGTNSGDSNSGDNTGQGPDYSQFWAEPPAGDSNSPSKDGSAENGTQSGGSTTTQQQQAGPASTLATDIQALDFGSGVMTQSAIEKLGNGDATEFHAGLNQMGKDAVTSAIRLIVPLMGQLRDQLRTEMSQTVNTTNTTRDNQAALLQAIPSAKDPKVAPIVNNIFNQALKLTKNDTNAAISMTKDMLRLQAQTLGNDVGIPPMGPGDSNGLNSSTKVDWLSELAGR